MPRPLSQARAYNDVARRRVHIRREQWEKPKVGGGRKPYAKARPDKWKWGDVPSTAPQGTYGRLTVDGMFSSMRRRINNLPVSDEKLERWWYIQNGQIPPEERAAYAIPTDEQMTERADDEMRALEMATDAKIEQLEEDYRNIIDKLHAEAMELEADDNPETRPNSLRQSKRLMADAEEAAAECRAEILQEGETLRAVRDETKAEMKLEQERAVERAAERVQELQRGLPGEIQEAADAYFTQPGFELEYFNLA